MTLFEKCHTLYKKNKFDKENVGHFYLKSYVKLMNKLLKVYDTF